MMMMKVVLTLMCFVTACICGHYSPDCPSGQVVCSGMVGNGCYDPTTASCCPGYYIPSTCPLGYKCGYGSSTFQAECVIDDSCKYGTVCGSGFKCTNTNGTDVCNDIDECAQYGPQYPNPCPQGHYTCTNTQGSFTCTDIDECATAPPEYPICPDGLTCVNNIGLFDCINFCDPNPCDQYHTCAPFNGTYACNPVPFYITSSMSGNFVVEPLGNASTPGTPLSLQEQVPGKLSQLWKYNADFTIENVQSGLVIDISGGYTGVGGAKVIVWTRKWSGWALNQKWIYNSTTKTFKSAAGSVVIDVYHASNSVGAGLIIWLPNKQTNQQFVFTASG